MLNSGENLYFRKSSDMDILFQWDKPKYIPGVLYWKKLFLIIKIDDKFIYELWPTSICT